MLIQAIPLISVSPGNNMLCSGSIGSSFTINYSITGPNLGSVTQGRVLAGSCAILAGIDPPPYSISIGLGSGSPSASVKTTLTTSNAIVTYGFVANDDGPQLGAFLTIRLG